MPGNRTGNLGHSLKADLWTILRETIKSDLMRKKHGCLPKMSTASKGYIGAWLASSFCERVNSVANKAVTKRNSLLLPDEVDMIVTLRIIRDFVRIMRESYDHSSLKNSQESAEDKEEVERMNLNNSS